MRKLCKINNEWKWVVFSEQEEKEIRDKHMEKSSQFFNKCLQEAVKIYAASPIRSSSVEDINPSTLGIASALFNKNCDAIYSVLQSALDEAIHDIQTNK